MMERRVGFYTSVAGVVAGLIIAAPAHGQDAPSMNNTTQVESGDSLGDIVVTAQKRSQNVGDVGITISAFSAETLADAGITNVTQLTDITPALNLSGSYGGQVLSFAIRGVTQQDFSAQAEGPIAVYLDDGYMALNNSAGIGLYDIDHIEVLKGPQGTLFGRNATGGLVNILTRKPSDVADGYVTASYGSYNNARLEGAFGGPIAPGISFRVAGAMESTDNFVKNLSPTGGDLGGSKSYSARAHLLFKPTSDLSILLSGYRSKSEFSWSPYYIFASAPVSDSSGTLVNDVEVPGPSGAGSAVTPGGSRRVISNYAQSNGGSNSLTGATAKLTWNFGPELTVLTDYKSAKTSFAIDNDGESSIINTLTDSSVQNFSQEVRLFGKEHGWRWYVGAYYLYIKARVDPNSSPLPDLKLLIDDHNELKTNSYSAFGQVEVDLSPTVTAVAGVRVTQENKDFSYRADLFSTDASGLRLTYLGPARSPYSGRQNSTLVNAKAQLEYRPTQGVLIYGGWSRGSKAGNFTSPFAGGTVFPDSALSYKPETLNAYEAGTKLSLIDRKLSVDGAAFYYDYQNYQAFQLLSASNLVVNRPAKSYGGEISLTARPVDGLTLSGGGSYTDSTVKDVPVTGVTRDRIAPFTSKWQGMFNAAYAFPALGGTMELSGGGHYTGSFFFSISNFDTTKVDSYWTFDSRLTWKDASHNWKLAAYMENIGQEKYRTVGFDLTALCGCTEAAYGTPRWYGVSITRNF